MMKRIHLELMQPGFGGEHVIEAASTMIAVEMARLGQKNARPRDVAGPRLAGLAPWQLRRIRDRIGAAPETGYPRAQELAELCGVSRSHLMRMFKASTGWPLHRFIADERLRAARRLLAEDRLSIKQIAAALGFCNPGHFANAFQRLEHMTPSEFRRSAAGR
jgi:AraC family transcriptional regulator